MTEDAFKDNVTSSSTWNRALYMLLFAIIFNICEAILALIVIFQFVLKVITGDINDRIKGFSKSLGRYIWQMIEFLTFQTEEKPFPFSEWPEQQPKQEMTPPATHTDSSKPSDKTTVEKTPSKKPTTKKTTTKKATTKKPTVKKLTPPKDDQ